MTRTRTRSISRSAAAALLLALALGANTSFAQEEPDVGVKVVASHEAIPVGSSGMVGIIYDIPPDFHLQLNDFIYAEVAEPEGVSLGPLSLPTAQSYEGDPVYKGRAVVKAPLVVGEGAVVGKQALKIKVGYQGCAEKPVFICFAPSEVVKETAFEILPAGADAVANASPLVTDLGLTSQGGDGFGGPAGTPPGEGGGSLEARVQKALASGSLVAFLLVFLGGVAMSFTPCVYPMIPITVSFIGGRCKGKLDGFVLSLFFVLGIALTYSIMGVAAAQTGALFGSAMQSPGVLLAVAAVLLIMGVSMLGAFDIALPAGVQTRIQGGASKKGGFIGALLMGGVTGLVASPCVGPVLIVLLTWVAQAGSVLLGFLFLFTFACGLGVLFLVLGTFAGAIHALPRSGEWMSVVKHVFGVILIVMGFYYLRPVIGDTVFWVLTGIFTIFVATFTGAFHRLPESPSFGMQFRKGLGAILLVLGVAVLGFGLLRAGNISLGTSPVEMATDGTAGMPETGLAWLPSDDEALTEARSSGKPVLVDFYADWCAACKELDHKTWVDPAVAKELERFILVKLDFTKHTPELAAKQSKYGVQGLPTVIMMDSEGNEVNRFAGFRGPEEVLNMLKEIAA